MIRDYRTNDKSEVIDLLRLNTPEYFDPSEEKDFENYLDHQAEDYFVYEVNSKIIGAGGINYCLKDKLARISWDMIDPKLQGKGIGKKLIQYRLKRINENPEIEQIMVRTSQLAYQFYEKFGFELERVEKDFWAKNFDLYQLTIKNNPTNL